MIEIGQNIEEDERCKFVGDGSGKIIAIGLNLVPSCGMFDRQIVACFMTLTGKEFLLILDTK